MPNNHEQGPVEQVGQEIASYVNLRMDEFKLSMVDYLSTTTAKAASFALILIFASIVCALFTAAFVYLLWLMIGSILSALLIAAGVYSVVAILIYMRRDRLFLNSTVRMYSRMFFSATQEKDSTNDDNPR